MSPSLASWPLVRLMVATQTEQVTGPPRLVLNPGEGVGPRAHTNAALRPAPCPTQLPTAARLRLGHKDG